MEKKYLDEYQRKISQMTEKEVKLRNIYLQKLLKNEYLGPRPNYPTMDKAWLQYYPEDVLMIDIPNKTVYEFMREGNLDNLDGYSISNLGKNYTYKELFEKIDEIERSLIQFGIKKGDIVTIAIPNSPENIFLFYAINKIGAISNFIDPRLKGEMLKNSINEVNSKLMICSDLFVTNIDEVVDQTTLENVVVARLSTSFPPILQKLYNIKNKMPKCNSNKIITWKDFISKGEMCNLESLNNVSSNSEDIACILHTSGTTGTSKKVKLSNYAINSMAIQYKNIGVEYNRSERFMNQVPPFLGYNIILSSHMPLCLGMTVVMLPNYDPDNFAKNVNKYKINHVLAGPADWSNFVNNPKIKKANYSGLVTMGSGSDKINESVLAEANKVIKEHGGRNQILEGYGMTEAGTAICTNLPNIIEELGVPLFLMTISIFDEEGNELEYGEEGEICVTGPTLMDGYYNDPVNTNNALKTHLDGRIWLHTNDIGIMNQNGTLTFKGRKGRTIIRHDGIKMSPVDIEKVVSDIDFVENCCVVGILDEEHGRGEVACCNVIIKDGITGLDDDKIKTVILDNCKKKLTSKYCIGKINIVEEFPLTEVGKVDFIRLKEICNEKLNGEKKLLIK